MEAFLFIAIMGAFAVGLAFGVLIMSLLAIASMGECELADAPPFPSHAQD